jgi:hypothetical protein
MKARFIIINWLLSLASLCIDTEHSPIVASIAAVIWFICSTLLFKRACQRGELDKVLKKFKLSDE